MAKRLQHRGGTTSQHSTFTGAVREVTVDTDKNTLVVHDGATAGGHPLATATNFTSTGIDDNATSTAITIDSSENVGIGTASPSAKLHVDVSNSGVTPNSYANTLFIESSSNTGLTIASGTSSYSSIYFATSTDNDKARIEVVHSDNSMRFTNNASERMRITSTGSVGVNTTSPDAKLEVRDDTNQNTTISASSSITTAGNYHDFTVASNNAHYAVGIRRQVTQSSPSSLEPRMDFFVQNTNTYLPADRGVKMTLLNNGRLGIGTSSPDEKLNVVGNIRAEAFSTPKLQLKRTGNNAGNGYIECLGADDSVDYKIAFAESAGAMSFDVGGSERMRIDSIGRLLIGTTSTAPYTSSTETGQVFGTGGSLQLSNDDNGSAGNAALFINQVNTPVTNTKSVRFFHEGTEVGTITVTNSSTAYNTSSDYRLKENVSYDFDATSRLKQLKPARFNFIADADTTVDGFIAHEVSSVVPEAISGEKDAVDEDGNPKYQGIDQSKLVPLLVKTIQELEARITTLEANNP